MAAKVRTDVFEGPFDLLLHLILRDEVDLYEVAVGDIVDAYLYELEQMKQLNLEVATEFLLIAATLIEMKSRRLLPGDDSVDLDDELTLWSDRDLLLARLLECRTFKGAAVELENMAALYAKGWPRKAGPDERYHHLVPDFLEGIRADDLRAAFLRATAPRPQPRVDLTHIRQISINVDEVVSRLATTLPGTGTVRFRDLTQSLVDNIEVVAYFLAVLELYKQNLVDVSQATTFGQIMVTWTGGADGAAQLQAADAYDG